MVIYVLVKQLFFTGVEALKKIKNFVQKRLLKKQRRKEAINLTRNLLAGSGPMFRQI